MPETAAMPGGSNAGRRVYKKIAALILVLFCARPVFSQNQLSDLQNSLKDFSASLTRSLPFNAAFGLNWSDAYIGKVFPGLPPRLGAGVALGGSTMNIKAFKGLLNAFDAGGLNFPFMPIPMYVAEARVGGLFLPFDLGIKFGILPIDSLPLDGVKFGYTLIGGALRVAPLELLLAGKSLLFMLPNISVGIGVNYFSGSVGVPVGSDISFSFQTPDAAHTLALAKPSLALSWKTTALDVTLQASKSFLIVTPYAGLGVSIAASKVGYSVKTKLTYDDSENDIEALKGLLSLAGFDDIDVGKNSVSSFIKDTGVSFRAFGGVSLNLTILRIDLTGMFNFADQNWGASIGLRAQL